MAKKKKNDLVRPEGMRAAEAAYVFPIPEANLLLQSHHTQRAQWLKKNLLSGKGSKKQSAKTMWQDVENQQNQELYTNEKQLAEEYGSGKRNLFNSNKDLANPSKGLREYQHNREGARNLHPDALNGWRDVLPTMSGTDYDPDWVGNAVAEINSNISSPDRKKAQASHISQHVLGNTGKVEESNLSASENLTPMAKKPKKPMVNEDGVPVMSAQEMIDLLPPEEVAKRQRQDARTDKKNAPITPQQRAQEKKRRLNPSSADYEKILSDVREAGGSYKIGPNKYYPEGTSYQGTTSTKDVDMASKKGKKGKASGAGQNMTPAVEAVVNRVEDATPEATPAKTKSSRTRTPEQQAARTQRERAKREASKEKTDATTSASNAVTTETPVTPKTSLVDTLNQVSVSDMNSVSLPMAKEKFTEISKKTEDPSTPASKSNMFGTYAEQKAANPVAPLETTPTRRDPASSSSSDAMPESMFGSVKAQREGTAAKPEPAMGYPTGNKVLFGEPPVPAEPQLFDHEKETVNDGKQSTVLPPRLRERISHFGTGAKNWAQAMVKPSAPQASPQAYAPQASASPQTLQSPTASAPQASAPASPYSAQPSMSGPDNSVQKGAYSAGSMSASNVNTGNSGRIGDENTHTQKISGGYGPVTATTSGRATSSGKGGVTASTSGNATSGHPRAQNASRGSRPTNKG